MQLTRTGGIFLISACLFIIIGHYFAAFFSGDGNAWLYVLLFYAAWILISFYCFHDRGDLKAMFRKGIHSYWNFLPLVFIIPVIFFLFIPNRHLLQLDKWLVINLVICCTGPWLEEIYWRGLFVKFFGTGVLSFVLSCALFALSHPLIFGVNSRGDSGLPALGGTFIVGAVWWVCYYKTRTLRGAVFTHFLMDIAGMAVYVLTNKVQLLLPDQ